MEKTQKIIGKKQKILQFSENQDLAAIKDNKLRTYFSSPTGIGFRLAKWREAFLLQVIERIYFTATRCYDNSNEK